MRIHTWASCLNNGPTWEEFLWGSSYSIRIVSSSVHPTHPTAPIHTHSIVLLCTPNYSNLYMCQFATTWLTVNPTRAGPFLIHLCASGSQWTAYHIKYSTMTSKTIFKWRRNILNAQYSIQLCFMKMHLNFLLFYEVVISVHNRYQSFV